MSTVWLSIDGDHVCALVDLKLPSGKMPDLQNGEAEFVKIEDMNDRRSRRTAMFAAYKKLCDRLGSQLGYYLQSEGLQ